MGLGLLAPGVWILVDCGYLLPFELAFGFLLLICFLLFSCDDIMMSSLWLRIVGYCYYRWVWFTICSVLLYWWVVCACCLVCTVDLGCAMAAFKLWFVCGCMLNLHGRVSTCIVWFVL